MSAMPQVEASLWESLWHRIEASLNDAASALRSSVRGFTPRIEHFSNAAFPLRAVATLTRTGLTDEEQIVLAIDYHWTSDRIRVTADITRGHQGPVLASYQYVLALRGKLGEAQLWGTADDVASFVEKSIELIRTELAARS